MSSFTTGQVRRLFQPTLRESKIRDLLREGRLDPPSCIAGRFLWSCADVARIAELIGRPVPTATMAVGGAT